jgi:3'-5' exonuclease
MFVTTRFIATELRVLRRAGPAVCWIRSGGGATAWGRGGRRHRWLSSSHHDNETTMASSSTHPQQELPSSGSSGGPPRPNETNNVQPQHPPEQSTNYVVVEDNNEEVSRRFLAAVERAVTPASTTSTISSTDSSTTPDIVRVAVTCRGDKISRLGSIELGSICFGGGQGGGEDESVAPSASSSATGQEVFLVDFKPDQNGDSHQCNERIQAVQMLLECDHVQKVMHDSRMAGDALYHRYGIRLVNVHDTSCCHYVETDGYEVQLNAILRHNGLDENPHRGKTFYKENPSIWSSRPLSPDMLEWGASGLAKLLTLADRQTETLRARGQYEDAVHQSTEFAMSLAHMELQHGIRARIPALQLIGAGGSNIRRLRHETGTSVYQTNDTPRTWMVYYQTQDALDAVLREMGY